MINLFVFVFCGRLFGCLLIVFVVVFVLVFVLVLMVVFVLSFLRLSEKAKINQIKLN